MRKIECAYCGDMFNANGHKKHERHCSARAKQYRGKPVGFESYDEAKQTSLGSHFSSGMPRALTKEERERLAEQISRKRKTTR